MLIVFVFSLAGQKQIDAGSLNMLYKDSVKQSNLSSDSHFIILKKAYNDAKESKNDSLIITSLISLSEYTQTIQYYSLAFEYSGEALYMAEESKDSLLMAASYSNFGVLNYMLYQKHDAKHYLYKSLQMYKSLFKEGKINAHKLVSVYFSVTLSHRQFKEYNKALVYLDSCYQIADTINATPVNRAYLDVEKGILLSSLGKIHESLLPLDKAKRVFESIKSTDKEIGEKGYLVIVYTYLGVVDKKLGYYTESQNYFNKALEVLKTNKRHIDFEPFVHERYSWLLYNMGEYKLAYEHLSKSTKLNERYFSTKTVSNNNFITIRSRYRDEIKAKNNKIIKQSLELAENKESMIMFRSILYSIVLLIIIAGLIIRNRYQNRKHKKEQLFNERKQKDAEELIELKNKELTASTLRLIEKEELIVNVRNQLKDIDNNREVKVVLNTLKYNENTLWEDFNNRFIAVNKNFYDNLQKKFPKLSPGDLKICALIKLNFSGKEMANLLGISIDSVHKARHRLRKKMELERNVNLATYIASI